MAAGMAEDDARSSILDFSSGAGPRDAGASFAPI
jgi:hypothetical protein